MHALAYEVGRLLGERGHVLVCGGRGGVMLEACRGAKQTGGLTVGILPGTDRAEANEYVDVPVVTGLGEARNAIVARTAEAVIAIGGGYGTLSEIAFALRFGRPVIGLATWGVEDPDRAGVPIVRVQSAADAVRACEQAAVASDGGGREG